MRRIFFVVMTCMFVFATCLVNANNYKVNVSDKLNVRESPSKSAPVISVLSDGIIVSSTSEILKLQNNEGIEWAEIQLADGQKGYVAASYLVKMDDVVEEKQPSTYADNEGLVLNVCYLLLLSLAIINILFEYRSHNHSSSWLRFISWLSLGTVVVLMAVYVDEFEDVLSLSYWRWGGWAIKGFFLSLIAAITLAAITLQIYNSFVKIVCGMVYKKHHSLLLMKGIHLGMFYWLNGVSILLMGLWPVLGCIVLVYILWAIIKMFRLLSPHYLLACRIVILGLIVMALNLVLSVMCLRSEPLMSFVYVAVSYLLFFIDRFNLSLYELYEEGRDRGYHLESRKMYLSPATSNPTSDYEEKKRDIRSMEEFDNEKSANYEACMEKSQEAYNEYEEYKREADKAYENYESAASKGKTACENAEINYRDAEDHERMARDYDDESHLKYAQNAIDMGNSYSRDARQFEREAEYWHRIYESNMASAERYYRLYENYMREAETYK